MNQHENAIIKDRRFENYQEFTYMHQNNQFTEGKIFGPLIRFAIPVLFALCLQSLYGAVDLLVVGRFVEAKDVAAAVSAVSNGSQIMHMVTMIVTSLAMGTTIMLGQVTVPSATYIQDSATGGWIIEPGVSVLTVTGTV